MKITRKAFKAWLESKNSRGIVGRRGDRNACPIARFISDTFLKDGLYVEVAGCIDIYDLKLHEPLPSLDIPLWAENFIARVDEEGRGGITAGKALQYLA